MDNSRHDQDLFEPAVKFFNPTPKIDTFDFRISISFHPSL